MNWKSVLFTIACSVLLIASSVSIAFRLAPMIQNVTQLAQNMNRITMAVNQLDQRLKVLEAVDYGKK